MAGNSSFDKLTTTTMEKYFPKMEDNIFTSKPLLYAINDFGAVETLDGGTNINEALMYAELRNQGSYAGTDAFAMDEDDGFTTAQYDWKQYYGLLKLKGIDIAKNSGAPAVLKLVENELKRAELSIAEALNAMLWGDGTGNGGKDFLGMDAIVDDALSLGGIDPTAVGNEWWQSTVTTSVGSLTTFNPIRTLYLTLSEGNDAPSNIFTTQLIYAIIDSLFTSNQRFMDPGMAQQGFESLMFHNAPISFDRNITTGDMFMLNLKYIKLYKLGDRWFKQSDWVEPPNQDVQYKKVLLAGQLTTSNRQRHGKLEGVTA